MAGGIVISNINSLLLSNPSVRTLTVPFLRSASALANFLLFHFVVCVHHVVRNSRDAIGGGAAASKRALKKAWQQSDIVRTRWQLLRCSSAAAGWW